MTDDKPGAAATPNDHASDEAVSADVRFQRVDLALAWADERTRQRPHDEDTWPEEELAAEVRRLRAELEQALGWHADQVRMVQLLEARQVLVEATNEQLCIQLERAHGQVRDLADQLNSMIKRGQAEAAELAKERGEKDAYWRSGERMVAKLARVEALPAKWRALYEETGRDREYLMCPECADQLEQALKP